MQQAATRGSATQCGNLFCNEPPQQHITNRFSMDPFYRCSFLWLYQLVMLRVFTHLAGLIHWQKIEYPLTLANAI